MRDSRLSPASACARALLATSNKTGVVQLANCLAGLRWEIIATEGTAALLRTAGIAVTDLSEVMGLPPMLGNRVKSLHYKIFGGLLMRRSNSADCKDSSRFEFQPIHLLACTFYPFKRAASSLAGPIENVDQIDVGGPAMLRAAAKNYENVIPLADPEDYLAVSQGLLAADGDPIGVGLAMRRRLASRAFAATAYYDSAISESLAG